ncbi:hypothetical protein [Nostoc sp. DedQUE03]|uniref:hypothetical protein n=1 Tax=Nostoc sp. DedQUE03 TaxID=3075389 RepID=UPI002ADC5E43|nr:hypothetical protein [Nostoc sp. DedQUE03]
MPGCSGVVELPGSVVLPGVPGCSGVVDLPGPGVKLLGAPSGVVELPGAGAESLGAPSGVVGLPGAGVKLLGPPGCSGVVGLPGAGVKLLGPPGAGVLSGVPDPDPGWVLLPGAVVLSGVVVPGVVVSAGVVVLLGALGVSAVPPGQREFSGKFSHRIFIPSGDILISAGALVESLLDWAMGDLLDSATAILVVNAKDKAVPIRVRDFPIILEINLNRTLASLKQITKI